MKIFVTALALTTALLASPAIAYTRHHYGELVPLPGIATWHHLRLAGNAIHDNDWYGEPPRPTGAYARDQDFEHYRPVDTYDVVMNGQIVGRDPDPFIRLQLLHEAQMPFGGR